MDELRTTPTFSEETRLLTAGFLHVAGIDEAGRGPLAGPVVAAACILDPSNIPAGIDDSKKLGKAVRERLEKEILACAVACAVAAIGPADIDRIGILNATKRAMRLAVKRLPVPPGFLLVDAVALNIMGIPQLALVHGDARSLSIAAASILAKTARDRTMRRMDRKYPGYAFANHVGYGTPVHIEALVRLGPSPIHRASFAHVRES